MKMYQALEQEPFWSCGAAVPSLCGGCPGTLDSACWGRSRCPSICTEKVLISSSAGETVTFPYWTEEKPTFYSGSLDVSYWARRLRSSAPFHLWAEDPFTQETSSQSLMMMLTEGLWTQKSWKWCHSSMRWRVTWPTCRPLLLSVAYPRSPLGRSNGSDSGKCRPWTHPSSLGSASSAHLQLQSREQLLLL